MSRIEFIAKLAALQTFFLVMSYILIPIPHAYAMIPLSVVGIAMSALVISVEQSLSPRKG